MWTGGLESLVRDASALHLFGPSLLVADLPCTCQPPSWSVGAELCSAELRTSITGLPSHGVAGLTAASTVMRT